MWKKLLYYASFVALYEMLGIYCAVQLFAFELFGPLKEDYSLWELLALPSSYWETKLAYGIWLLMHFPFGIPFLYVKNDTLFLQVAIILDSLFMAWLLQRVFNNFRWQRVNIGQAQHNDL